MTGRKKVKADLKKQRRKWSNVAEKFFKEVNEVYKS